MPDVEIEWWNPIPEWARFVVQHGCGHWNAHPNHPTWTADGWDNYERSVTLFHTDVLDNRHEVVIDLKELMK